MSVLLASPRPAPWTRGMVFLTDVALAFYALSWLVPHASAPWPVHLPLVVVEGSVALMFLTIGICRSKRRQISIWSTLPLWNKVVRLAAPAALLLVMAIKPHLSDTLVFPIICWVVVAVASWRGNRKARSGGHSANTAVDWHG